MSMPDNDREFWVRCDTLFTPYQRRRDWLLHIVEGKIRRMLPATGADDVPADKVFHRPGAMVAPGFVDLHVHGAAGCDFMDGTEATLSAAAATLARHGTTSFLATTMSAPQARLESTVRSLASFRTSPAQGARMIGIHLEGPYLNPLRSGTHGTPFLRGTDVGEFRRLAALSENRLCRITIAPEMDPGLKVVREAAERGIQVSLGHSDATEEQTIAAIDAGATHITHTGNAMRPFHQREPGIFGVALTDDRVFTEIIADGVHLHATTLQLLLASKGVDRTLLVTDGLSAVGMPDGNYPLGDKTVTVRGGECRDEKGRLAGSTLTLDRAVRNLVEWLDVPLHEALTAASATPARSMRMGDSIGMIRPGADADLIFLSRDLVVLHTMVAGRTVYSRAFSDFQTQTSDRKT